MGLMIGRWLKKALKIGASIAIPLAMEQIRSAESAWLRKHTDHAGFGGEAMRHVLEERLPELNARIEEILRGAVR